MFALLPSLVSVLAAVGVSEARPGQPQQQPEQAAPPPPRVFSSTERIHTLASSVSPDYHTTFKHPSFPGHGLRIKETTGWCEPKARSYTGYIDTDGHGQSLFFYFFESRSNPAEDDVFLWINGGPGASSAMGLFIENGPCSVDHETGELVYREESWTQHASGFFLDSPAEVGFSFSQGGQPLRSTTEGAAIDIQAFVQIFFETFSEYRGRPFHMSGESYGGRYLPVFAAAVLDGNVYAAARNVTPINLASVAIGNGWTDSLTMYAGYVEQQCTKTSGVGPIQSVGECVRLQQRLPRCLDLFQTECIDRFDMLACGNAVDFCSEFIFAFQAIRPVRNWYDISEICPEEGHCSTEQQSKDLADYLNKSETQAILGIDPEWKGPWGIDRGISNAFGAIFSYGTMDVQHQTKLYVASLVEHGVRVLIYAGDVDFACNAAGVRKWVEGLQWSGSAGYQNATEQPWFVDGAEEPAGVFRTGGEGLLTYATVHNAGHLVPTMKPVEALHLIERFWADKSL